MTGKRRYNGTARQRAVTREAFNAALGRHKLSRRDFAELSRMATDEAWAWEWSHDDWYHGC
jgi:hypothetical protein